jgi:methionyl-tRNA synthetase
MATFYITTPIYYVNDVPHIGHAYTTVAADVLARYHRLRGDDTFFLTGLDEHGQKVQQAAARAGIDPQVYCDGMVPRFQDLWKQLNVSNDAFIRTTHPRHKRIVQDLLQRLYDRGEIYRADYTGWYCTFDERFWTEKDVIDGLCPDCRRPVERLSESNYFFRMSRYQPRLQQYIKEHPDYIRPESRRNEVSGFLQRPLEDLSISRPTSRLSWGIPLPFDPDYVTYVWFDALVNYYSALDYLTPHPSTDRYWPASVHLVGKDILTTHAVYWSTMLMALGLPLPRTIFAHGWWTVNGEKMSKSRGNVVDPGAMAGEFGVDAFRYFLLREVPFGHDGDFSREAFIGRLNSDLANGLGNLLSRTLTMIERFAGGKIPVPVAGLEVAKPLAGQAADAAMQVGIWLEKFEFHKALERINSFVQYCDQYLDHKAPWLLAKKPENQGTLDTVLYAVAEALRHLSLLTAPFMPQTATEIARQLGVRIDVSQPFGGEEHRWGRLSPGTAIQKGNPLFPRIDVTKPQGGSRVTPDDRSGGSPIPAAAPAAAPPQPAASPAVHITIEDFQKVQLRTGKVLAAERVPRSEKLIKLQVDLGSEQRQVVAGIGKKYEPDSLIGKTVVIVANLKPAKLMGVESQGMVLAAGDAEVLELLTLPSEVPPGVKVK